MGRVPSFSLDLTVEVMAVSRLSYKRVCDILYPSSPFCSVLGKIQQGVYFSVLFCIMLPLKKKLKNNIHTMEYCSCCSLVINCLTLCDLMNCSSASSSIHGISRREYWRGFPFPSPGDLPDPGIKPTCPTSPALAAVFFTLKPHGKCLQWNITRP